MPRGPVVYTLPPGTTPQIAGTTIEPAVFNAAMDDIANTFNTVQPPEYGGTGGASAAEAREKLGLEIDVNVSSVPRGHIYGLAISNNATDATNDIDIAPGQAASDAAAPVMLTLASALTKRLDAAWTVGSGNGGLDTGSKTNSTWYHVWLIRRSDTGVVDALFSLSPTAPTMPASYDGKQLLGSIYVGSGGSIRPFLQVSNSFLWRDIGSLDYSATVVSGGVLIATFVPPGRRVKANLRATIGATPGAVIYILTTPDVTSVAPSPTGSALSSFNADDGGITGGEHSVITDTSRQIMARTSLTTESLRVYTYGWEEMRT